MSISNREDVNRYYQLINELIDNYIDKWKIKPSNLGKYLKPGSDRFNKFLIRNNLSEIKGADVILKDIIEDRISMEHDGIMKFENYKLFESEDFKITSISQCLYKGIDKADIRMEKILADYYDTNLSDIDIVNSDKHIFRIKIWNNIKFIISYTKDEFDIIKSNMLEYMYDNLSKKKIELTNKISIDLNNLIDIEKYNKKINSILTDELTTEVISDLLNNYKFIEKYNEYYIWEYQGK